MRRQPGQATLELVALVPLLLLCLAAATEGVIAAWAAVEAADAARAGARAAALGGDPARTARAAIPSPLRTGAAVRVDRGRIVVSLAVPAFVPGLDLRVEGDAA